MARAVGLLAVPEPVQSNVSQAKLAGVSAPPEPPVEMHLRPTGELPRFSVTFAQPLFPMPGLDRVIVGVGLAPVTDNAVSQAARKFLASVGKLKAKLLAVNAVQVSVPVIQPALS